MPLSAVSPRKLPGIPQTLQAPSTAQWTWKCPPTLPMPNDGTCWRTVGGAASSEAKIYVLNIVTVMIGLYFLEKTPMLEQHGLPTSRCILPLSTGTFLFYKYVHTYTRSYVMFICVASACCFVLLLIVLLYSVHFCYALILVPVFVFGFAFYILLLLMRCCICCYLHVICLYAFVIC